MAVTGGDSYQPTDRLILAKPRRHYNTGVRWQHWQLRSLIGAEGHHIVYFPTGASNTHIQRLNTITRETETIKRLAFPPRCLVAHGGWVCCGGEKGAFTAIRTEEDQDDVDVDNDDGSRQDQEADDPIPMLFDSARDASILATIMRARTSTKNLVAERKTFGRDRVNCITLWSPPSADSRFENAYDQPVAVLANNDKTVTVVSLADQEALDDITYPDYMNRAVISPDGRLLVAISDDPYLYIHEKSRTREDAGSEWNSRGRIQLKSQSKDDRSDNRGSFAACFSSSGKYLAVGTQYGTISVFHVPDLASSYVDPFILSFTSSRRDGGLGAIRDMAFAPAPMDLLAWTEDRGRVGIADLRTRFVSRQILNLDAVDDYEHIDVTDRGTIDPRLVEARDRNDALATNFASTLDLSLEVADRQPRRSPDSSRDALDRYNTSLTAEETAVLEAFQGYRRRREQRAAAQASESSSNTAANSANERERGGGLSSGMRSIWSSGPSDRHAPPERSVGTNRAVNDILGSIRDRQLRAREDSEQRRRSLRDLPEQQLRTLTEQHEQPFREQNLANSGDVARRRPFPRASALASGSPYTGERRAIVQRLLSATNVAANDSAAPTGTTSNWDNVEALAAYLMREWEENPTRRGFSVYMTSRDTSHDPYDTAGLSWSEDGQVLFVGADSGIYEFHVDLLRRKLFPSMTLS